MRNQYFDVLKAIAIIAVVLYHLGTCEYGYLGVDIFLVIAGYFTSQSIEKQIANGKGCLLFAINRLFRLLPLLLLAGVVCLGWGWMLMLPDDFENTAQSIVATIGIASLVAYLLEKNAASKFYFLPYRLYEFCAGGLMFYLFGKKQAM